MQRFCSAHIYKSDIIGQMGSRASSICTTFSDIKQYIMFITLGLYHIISKQSHIFLLLFSREKERESCCKMCKRKKIRKSFTACNKILITRCYYSYPSPSSLMPETISCFLLMIFKCFVLLIIFNSTFFSLSLLTFLSFILHSVPALPSCCFLLPSFLLFLSLPFH